MQNQIKDDELIKHTPKREILKRLFSYLKPYKFKCILVILILIFVMMINILNPYILKYVVDVIIVKKDVNLLILIGVFMTVGFLISMVLSKLRIKMMANITNSMLITIRHELYTHIQKLSFSFFDNRPVGKILARIMGDINSLQDLFNNAITSFIPELLTLIFVAIIMFSINIKLAVITLLILPFLVVTLMGIEFFSWKRWHDYRQKRSNFNAYIHENFSGIKIIKSYATEEDRSNSFFEFSGERFKKFMKCILLSDLFWPNVELSWAFGSALVAFFGIKMVLSGEVSIGTVISFSIYTGMFWRPILNLSNFYNTLIINLTAAERIFDIMDIKPDIHSINDDKKMAMIKGEVEFKNVTFSYDDGVDVLKNVSFKIKAGESIALVGPTGAGKTTIINLITRFYDPSEGEILIDGVNIKDVELESLRSQMGIMLQDTFLFSDTIKENIKYGKLDATDEEIIEASKAVKVHNFVSKFENGYDTNVNERGASLSVGERQLISFSRALLSDPRILILDEATSNIDTETEKLVQEGIKKLLSGRTSFVIAHRLSTIRDADRIMVVEDGRISEEGSHEELLNNKGLYYELYMAQYRFLKEGA